MAIFALLFWILLLVPGGANDTCPETINSSAGDQPTMIRPVGENGVLLFCGYPRSNDKNRGYGEWALVDGTTQKILFQAGWTDHIKLDDVTPNEVTFLSTKYFPIGWKKSRWRGYVIERIVVAWTANGLAMQNQTVLDIPSYSKREVARANRLLRKMIEVDKPDDRIFAVYLVLAVAAARGDNLAESIFLSIPDSGLLDAIYGEIYTIDKEFLTAAKNHFSSSTNSAP